MFHGVNRFSYPMIRWNDSDHVTPHSMIEQSFPIHSNSMPRCANVHPAFALILIFWEMVLLPYLYEVEIFGHCYRTVWVRIIRSVLFRPILPVVAWCCYLRKQDLGSPVIAIILDVFLFFPNHVLIP